MDKASLVLIVCRDCGTAQIYHGGDTICPNCESENVFLEDEDEDGNEDGNE